MKIAIVADDLTGALDAAVPFADLGLGTSVALKLGAAGVMAAGDTPVVSIDACTRHLSSAEAAAAVRNAMQRLLTLGERLPFKKMDSTLRGNVGAETFAALAGSGRRIALISPAAPRLGRCLRGGRLLVNGEAAGVDLVQTLRVQLPDVPVRRLAPGEELRSTGESCQLLVADAEEETHLDQWVDVALARPEEILLVGSSGLAAALARRGDAVGSRGPVDVPRRHRRILFVVGSRNSRSVAQLQALLGTDGVTDLGNSFCGSDGQSWYSRGAIGQVAVLRVKRPGEASSPESVLVAQRLAEMAGSLVAGDPVDDIAIVMTGGDTARSVLDRLAVQALQVSRSLAPGVVLAKAELRGQSVSIVTKAGGFGETDLFIRIARQLLEEH